MGSHEFRELRQINKDIKRGVPFFDMTDEELKAKREENERSKKEFDARQEALEKLAPNAELGDVVEWQGKKHQKEVFNQYRLADGSTMGEKRKSYVWVEYDEKDQGLVMNEIAEYRYKQGEVQKLSKIFDTIIEKHDARVEHRKKHRCTEKTCSEYSDLKDSEEDATREFKKAKASAHRDVILELRAKYGMKQGLNKY